MSDEPLIMGSTPSNDESHIEIEHREHSIAITLGAFVTVAEVAKALASIPQESVFMTSQSSYFCGEDNCPGTDTMDHVHNFFVTTILLDPGES